MTDGDREDSGTRAERSRRALVLWSGGLDSTTVLAVARSRGFQPLALIFRYGQRHAVEVELAERGARRSGLEYRIVDLDLRSIGASALTADGMEVPKGRDAGEIAAGGIPSTYVPARNTIFLAYSLAWAEVLEIGDIFIGVNALDYSGYPDCRPEYIAAFETLAGLALRSSVEEGKAVRIHAPLIDRTKAEIIRWGVELGVDYAATWSCYSPQVGDAREALACGECDSCQLRRRGFAEAGVPDPTCYVRDVT